MRATRGKGGILARGAPHDKNWEIITTANSRRDRFSIRIKVADVKRDPLRVVGVSSVVRDGRQPSRLASTDERSNHADKGEAGDGGDARMKELPTVLEDRELLFALS